MSRSIWMLGLVALLIAAPMVIGGEFRGTDNQAADMVGQLRPGHEPWIAPLWAPDPALEGLIFTLQAVLGALVVGYVAGRLHGARRANHPAE